jgi:hypothetical protein
MPAAVARVAASTVLKRSQLVFGAPGDLIPSLPGDSAKKVPVRISDLPFCTVRAVLNAERSRPRIAGLFLQGARFRRWEPGQLNFSAASSGEATGWLQVAAVEPSAKIASPVGRL